MILAAIFLVVVAFVLSGLGTYLTRGLAARHRIMDVPTGHKSHARPVPLLGGCAIFAAIAVPTVGALALVSYWQATAVPSWVPLSVVRHFPGLLLRSNQALGILLGAGLLHAMGLRDDRRHMSAWKKLLIQTAVACAVVGFCRLRVLSLLGDPWSYIVTVVWIVVVTNAFNFLDNMDGLSTGVAGICAAALLGAAAGMGQWFVAAWLCLLLGSLAGFLPHNFPPAKTFMGDAGSLVIGYFLAVLCCLTTYVPPQDGPALHAVFVPLVLMAIPLYDMASVIILRIKERRNPMIGDTCHFSHRLVRRGMTVRRALLTIYLCTIGTAIAASLLPHVSGTTGAMLVFAQTISILLMVALLETSGRNR